MTYKSNKERTGMQGKKAIKEKERANDIETPLLV